MALTTQVVTATVSDQGGNPVVGAVISAELDKTDFDTTDGIVFPSTVSATTDGAGMATLALWPNARGNQTSRYFIKCVDSLGALLFRGFARVPDAAANLFAILDLEDQLDIAPHPAPDHNREDQLVADVIDFAKMPDSEVTRARVKRWLGFVMTKCNVRRWWFLENVVSTVLQPGQDVVDVKGDFDRAIGLYAPARLKRASLPQVLNARAHVNDRELANSGPVKFWALEGSRRIHLFPAPSSRTTFTLHYLRPFAIPILLPEFESILFDGVVGFYGRHFDRSALIENPADFVNYFQSMLKKVRPSDFDTHVISAEIEQAVGTSTIDIQSAVNSGTEVLVPASLSGIGYSCIYALEVV